MARSMIMSMITNNKVWLILVLLKIKMTLKLSRCENTISRHLIPEHAGNIADYFVTYTL